MLQKVLINLMSRQRIPDDIVISAVEPADIPEIDHNAANVRSVFGSAGLTSQRNRGMSSVTNTADLIAFIDNDVIVGHDYFLNMESIFGRDDSVVGVTGEVIADSLGFTFDEALRLAGQYGKREKPASVLRQTRGTYGCNMAFRTARMGSLRFDERLPLYEWQDPRFLRSAPPFRAGRVDESHLGIHLGTKRGMEARFGSDIRRSSIRPIS